MKIGVYPGSFDPATLGHLDIIKRSAKLVDKLIVGVLHNRAKNPLFTIEERVNLLKELTEDMGNVEVDSFSGLLVDFLKEKNAEIIVRGFRAVSDFEYELQIAQTNYSLDNSVETICLITRVEYSFLSASVVKEVAMYGGDISNMVPEKTIEYMKRKFQ
ncbi:pantetheine-phosphate adenylyltransferase [Vallitalea pronyensis]|uniref:Phosphopantetheine adenylyltransferase n=1 Tax=Vallitalea pronyensis TaxID=1348613 RepID=A0A8J8MK58_9FIRM|nr:pantetheine-phosphate adenylyltransferase [Vallitalea pronyensis]QUI22936.1 pantetheine-phosphate adenylyltransferase [Vallitalea pronyensis]